MSGPAGAALGDVSSVTVRRWVGIYTRGLPAEVRDRRREEVAADLADEFDEADRTGSAADLRFIRLSRLVRGIPSDLSWRLAEGRRRADPQGKERQSMPASRLSLVLLGAVALLAAIGLVLSMQTIVTLGDDPDRWQSWGLYGFVAGTAAVIVGAVLAARRPLPGGVVALVGALVGALATPWLLIFWILVPIAVASRLVGVAPRAPVDEVA